MFRFINCLPALVLGAQSVCRYSVGLFSTVYFISYLLLIWWVNAHTKCNCTCRTDPNHRQTGLPYILTQLLDGVYGLMPQRVIDIKNNSREVATIYITLYIWSSSCTFISWMRNENDIAVGNNILKLLPHGDIVYVNCQWPYPSFHETASIQVMSHFYFIITKSIFNYHPPPPKKKKKSKKKINIPYQNRGKHTKKKKDNKDKRKWLYQ